jgi:MraZ protein
MPSPQSHPISYAGTFERSMDAKNRVTVPAAWLDGGPGDFHSLASPTGDFLIVMPPAEFDAMEERIKSSGVAPGEQRRAIRQFYGQARAVAADSQGRILLPEEQCSATGLRGEVALVGGKSRFEIWSAERWSAVREEESATFQRVAELIGL